MCMYIYMYVHVHTCMCNTLSDNPFMSLLGNEKFIVQEGLCSAESHGMCLVVMFSPSVWSRLMSVAGQYGSLVCALE